MPDPPPPTTPPAADRAARARAFARFTDLLDADDAERDAQLAALAAEDPDVHRRVVALLAKDATPDPFFDGRVAPGQALLAHDLLSSLIARGDLAPLPPPATLGPYRILGELGRGAMGTVYEGEQLSPHRRVAIKTAHPWMRTPELSERFRFETQALATLRHRAIPRLFEVREEDGATWMVMELVRGDAVDVYARELPIEARLRLLVEIADGVHHAHLAGIVHRDLKPANILVAEHQPRILDFGLATPNEVSGGGAAGTLAYMAPEQLAGDPTDARVDVYALGVLTYELLTGERPPGARGATVSELRANKRLPPPPVSRRAGLGRDLDFILRRALAPDPDARYPSARVFADDLRAYLARRPVAARPATLAYRLERLVARHRALVRGVAATLTVVAVIALTFALLRAHDARQRHEAREQQAAERLARLEGRVNELRAAGSADEAETLFDYFLDAPEHAGTRALHDAWLRRGALLSDAGDSHAASRAYAEAWTHAPDAAARVAALRELGLAFARAGAWSGVGQVIARLDALAPDDPVAQTLRAGAAAERRDLLAIAAATSADARALAPVLRALAPALPLAVPATNAWPAADAEPGTANGFVVLDQPRERLVSYGGGARPELLGAVSIPPETRYGHGFPRFVPGVGVLRIALDGELLLERFDPGAPDGTLALDARLDATHAHAVAGSTRPGGTGLLIGTAGGRRELIRWRPDRAAEVVPAEVVGPPSDVDALLVADLDGDGRDEIVVAAGAWRTYDLRVLRAGADDRLELVARTRLGVVQQLALLRRPGRSPLVLAAKQNRYPNAAIFGAAQPAGPPAGLYLFEFAADALEGAGFLPYPPRAGGNVNPYVLVVGDFDGDGLDDVAVGTSGPQEELTSLYRQTAPGRFASVAIVGMSPLAAVDVDGDGRSELIVRATEGRRGWVLGVEGEPPLPPRREAPVQAAATPVPADLGPLYHADWRRASELESMGLAELAGARLEAAARLAANKADRAILLVRAGALLRAGGDPRRAADLLEEVLAPDSGLRAAARPAAHREAAAALREQHEVRRARAHEALADGPMTAAAAHPSTATSRAADAAWDAIGAGRLSPGWSLRQPAAWTRAGHGVGEVRVDAFNGQGVLGVAPLSHDGGRVVLELDLVVEELELAAGLTVAVRDSDGRDAVTLRVWGHGGAASISLVAGCGPFIDHSPPHFGATRAATAEPTPMRLRVDVLPGDDGAASILCEIHQGERRVVSRRYTGAAPPAGSYDLIVAASRIDNGPAASWFRGTVRRLTVRGPTPREAPRDPRADALRALFEGDAGPILARAAGGDEGALDALLAEVAVGAVEAAQARLTAAPELFYAHGARPLVRLAPEVVVPIALRHDRRRAAAHLAAIWRVGLRYRDHAHTRAFTILPALETLDGRDAAELELVIPIVRGLLRQGAIDPARRRLEAALAVDPKGPKGSAGLGSPGTADERPVEALAELELLLGVVYLAAGDEAAARAQLARWRALTPFADLALEALPHDPEAGALATLGAAGGAAAAGSPPPP